MPNNISFPKVNDHWKEHHTWKKQQQQQQPCNHGKSKNVKMPTFTQLF